MYLNASRQYPSAQTLIAEVDNFDAPSNNTDASLYSNLDSHAHRAIIKPQLRPSTQVIFNKWATRLGIAKSSVQTVVQQTRVK